MAMGLMQTSQKNSSCVMGRNISGQQAIPTFKLHNQTNSDLPGSQSLAGFILLSASQALHSSSRYYKLVSSVLLDNNHFSGGSMLSVRQMLTEKGSAVVSITQIQVCLMH